MEDDEDVVEIRISFGIACDQVGPPVHRWDVVSRAVRHLRAANRAVCPVIRRPRPILFEPGRTSIRLQRTKPKVEHCAKKSTGMLESKTSDKTSRSRRFVYVGYKSSRHSPCWRGVRLCCSMPFFFVSTSRSFLPDTPLACPSDSEEMLDTLRH